MAQGVHKGHQNLEEKSTNDTWLRNFFPRTECYMFQNLVTLLDCAAMESPLLHSGAVYFKFV